VKVPPPTEEDAIKIINGIKDKYEKFHAVSYNREAINFRYRIRAGTSRTASCRNKAIDLIDEAWSAV